MILMAGIALVKHSLASGDLVRSVPALNGCEVSGRKATALVFMSAPQEVRHLSL